MMPQGILTPIYAREQTRTNKICISQDNHDFLFGKQTKDLKETFYTRDCENEQRWCLCELAKSDAFQKLSENVVSLAFKKSEKQK